MRVITFFSMLASVGVAALAQAGSTSARELSLQDCVQMALTNNLEIQVSRYNPEIARLTWRADYGAYDPQLTLSGQHDRNQAGSEVFSGVTLPGTVSDKNTFDALLSGTATPWGTTYSLGGNVFDSYGHTINRTNGLHEGFGGSQGDVSLQLRQALLKNFWINETRLTIKLDKNLVKRDALGLAGVIMDKTRDVEEAYNNLIYFRENVVVQQKAVEAAEQLVAENRKRVEVGALAPLDEKQAESQAASSRADLITARSSLAIQEHLLKSLITANYGDWAEVHPEPTASLAATRQVFDRQDSWGKALSSRPEILQAQVDVENAGIRLKFFRNQLFPQLDVFGTYGYNGSGAEFSDSLHEIQQRDAPFYTYGGQLSIPLTLTRERNNFKSSKVTLQQMVVNVKLWERNIMREVDDSIQNAQAGYERVEATKAAREYAEQALAAEMKKLEQGKSTTYTVLQLQRDLTRSRGDEISALATYNNYLSDLSRAEGSILVRLGIDLQVSVDGSWY